MTLVVIRLEDESSFGSSTPAAEPVGAVIAHTRTAAQHVLDDVPAVTGIWECTPGQFRRKVVEAEYSYIIQGSGSFTPDGSDPVEFKAGDAVYFAANTEGTWDVRETVRKTYFILKA